MITRTHQSARLGYREAHYSECERYRYALTINWSGAPTLTCCGLNPSTATEKDDDRTIAKMIRLAKRWQYGSLIMVNLFAFRATKPADMLKESDPIGPENTRAFLRSMTDTDFLCAWGTNGEHMERGQKVFDYIKACGHRLFYLRLTKGGHPEHPLYIGETGLQMTPWSRR